jgi:D-alanyl-D-alanine carboxypeptidase
VKHTVAVLAALLMLVTCERNPEANVVKQEIEAPAEPRVHAHFDLTEQTLAGMLRELPESARLDVLDRPAVFLDLLVRVSSSPSGIVRRVDREHPLPEGYVPDDLVDLGAFADRFDLSRDGHRVREIVVGDLSEMVDAARVDGVTLLVSSAYRSFGYQSEVYEYWVETLGRDEADRISARPGTSQHQLGTTMDFGCICEEFAGSAAGMWLAANAWRYGFSLSYPDGYEHVTGYAYESWHYRYLGRAATEMERAYFSGIQHDLLEFLDGSMDAIMMFHDKDRSGRRAGGIYG